MIQMRPYLFLLFSFLFSCALQAQYFSNIEFIENKGQWDNRVKYTGEIPAGAFFIRSGGFTVLQHNHSDLEQIAERMHKHPDGKQQGKEDEKLVLHSHAYNVDFLGANANIEIIPDKPVSSYNNYFIGNDPAKWASGCKIYQAVTLKNVYPNVDVRYYTENGKLKYDIVAKPGADIKKIALKYEGVDKLEIKNKELVIGTSVEQVKELSPYTYQLAGKEKKDLTAKYIIKNNIVRFDIKGYDPNSTIVIDPTLVFVSFSGATSDNWGYTATYGPDGSMFGGGIVFNGTGGAGFPVSPGAFQTTFGGGSGGNEAIDMGIIKLSPNGQNACMQHILVAWQ